MNCWGLCPDEDAGTCALWPKNFVGRSLILLSYGVDRRKVAAEEALSLAFASPSSDSPHLLPELVVGTAARTCGGPAH